jgi:hypothetical protein
MGMTKKDKAKYFLFYSKGGNDSLVLHGRSCGLRRGGWSILKRILMLTLSFIKEIIVMNE